MTILVCLLPNNLTTLTHHQALFLTVIILPPHNSYISSLLLDLLDLHLRTPTTHTTLTVSGCGSSFGSLAFPVGVKSGTDQLVQVMHGYLLDLLL